MWYEIIGVLGLIFIIIGVLTKGSKRRYLILTLEDYGRMKRDLFFILGGTLLFVYSILIQNTIFAILQAVFTIAAVYDFLKQSKQ